MSSFPEFVEPLLPLLGFGGAEARHPGGAAVGKGALDPVQAHQKCMGSPGAAEDREIRGPTSEGGGPKLEGPVSKKPLYSAKCLSLSGVHVKGESLLFQGLGIDVGDQDAKPSEAIQLPFGEIHSAEPDFANGGVQPRTPGKKSPEHLPEGCRTPFIEEEGAVCVKFLHGAEEYEEAAGRTDTSKSLLPYFLLPVEFLICGRICFPDR